MLRGTLPGLAIIFSGLLVAVSEAQKPDAVPQPDVDLKTVVQATTKYSEAFAQRDAKALAALFTPAAEYVDAAGTIFHGRASIEAEYAASFLVNPPGKIEIELLSVRPIADGVLVEEGVSTFVPTKTGPAVRTRYSATHVRQADGNWLIASVRELTSALPTPHDRLLALEWLVGSWHEDVAGNSIVTTWKWDPSGNFLLSEFAIQQSNGVGGTGTHRIGWDGERKLLRSWIFDSTGATTEGWWQRNDDSSWTLHLTRIDAEGVRTSSQLTYAADGKDAILVSQNEIVQNGIGRAGGLHRIVKQPPAPAPPGR